MIFYNGNLDLFNEKSISVVGTRRPSDVGINNSQRIAKFLANNNITIVSGLAEGVDSITQDYALKLGYNKLISVIGTPISNISSKNCIFTVCDITLIGGKNMLVIEKNI